MIKDGDSNGYCNRDKTRQSFYDLNRRVIGSDPDRLSVGIELVIPPTDCRAYKTQSGETLSAIAQRFYNDADRWHLIYDSNRREIGDYPDQIHPAGSSANPKPHLG